MANSIYGNGGTGVVATTATEAAPTIGLANLEKAVTGITSDVVAFNAVSVKHTGTTDGTTASASFLAVKVTSTNGKVMKDILMPGERGRYQFGLHVNNIAKVELWTLLPGSPSVAGAANVQVIVGGMVNRE